MLDILLPVGQAGGSASSTVAVMKTARRWLLWQEVLRPGKLKPDKVPFYLDGSRRSGKLDTPDDLARLATYNECKAALAKFGPDTHLGFALGPDGSGGSWQGIDLDDIENKCLSLRAEELPGYVEWSPEPQRRTRHRLWPFFSVFGIK